MLKADVSVPESPALREIAEIAMEGVGPKKAVAANVGKDRSLIRRQVQAGTFTLRDLEALGSDFAIDFATEILERIGPLATPEARARALIRDQRRALDELEQLVDHMAS